MVETKEEMSIVTANIAVRNNYKSEKENSKEKKKYEIFCSKSIKMFMGNFNYQIFDLSF